MSRALAFFREMVAEGGLSHRKVCEATGIDRKSERRWRDRHEAGEPLLRKRGPRKLVAVDYEKIKADARELDHGPRRTQDGPGLARRHSESASRREVGGIVRAERRRQERERRAALSEVRWEGAMVAWAMDDTELKLDGRRVVLHNVRDLASGYGLEPLCMQGRVPSGKEVAANLEWLFRSNGAPLILKRDNAGNFCCDEVDEVLARWGVIPLTSPPYTPAYNGAVERSQGALKEEFMSQVSAASCPLGAPQCSLQPFARLASHSLNHRPKGTCTGPLPCHMFATSRIAFDMRYRKKAFKVLLDRKETILELLGPGGTPQSAWRRAVSEYLQKTGLMTLTKSNRVNQF